MLLALFAACATPAAPADTADTADTADPATPPEVNLRVAGILPSGSTVCTVLVDGSPVAACDEDFSWPATAAVIAVGAGDAWSEDGLPLHEESATSLWVAPYHEVDLSQAAPYYSAWIVSQEDGDWYAGITLNRWVGGDWDCGERGTGSITVLEGMWLTLDPALWGARTPFPIAVSGNDLTPQSGNEIDNGGWTVSEDALTIGLWGDDGGPDLRWDCTRA